MIPGFFRGSQPSLNGQTVGKDQSAGMRLSASGVGLRDKGWGWVALLVSAFPCGSVGGADDGGYDDDDGDDDGGHAGGFT